VVKLWQTGRSELTPAGAHREFDMAKFFTKPLAEFIQDVSAVR
jgi:hypothetical protein